MKVTNNLIIPITFLLGLAFAEPLSLSLELDLSLSLSSNELSTITTTKTWNEGYGTTTTSYSTFWDTGVQTSIAVVVIDIPAERETTTITWDETYETTSTLTYLYWTVGKKTATYEVVVKEPASDASIPDATSTLYWDNDYTSTSTVTRTNYPGGVESFYKIRVVDLPSDDLKPTATTTPWDETYATTITSESKYTSDGTVTQTPVVVVKVPESEYSSPSWKNLTNSETDTMRSGSDPSTSQGFETVIPEGFTTSEYTSCIDGETLTFTVIVPCKTLTQRSNVAPDVTRSNVAPDVTSTISVTSTVAVTATQQSIPVATNSYSGAASILKPSVLLLVLFFV